ncbi:phosphatidylserine decarboxylase-domain-containing protein [Cantharellus anzutake]|uniref:phosphatidylserine decarboxylase-domain-containing protein n=1 Tax=Cantharellus anzutake TaxID=1750568 RepID=UPI0019050993|nr:phosphatidylserine decarboxylase-domain-containing protein [Cantharellus anzutake]KAF8334008.1 phosphatidylserine decarboxylase-domain-containing protein [Cantharellus anzutake]
MSTQQDSNAGDVVDHLRTYLKEHPDVFTAFELGVQIALRINVPQLKQFHIHNLNDYLNFYERLLHWIPTETFDGKNVYYHLCLFYFILDLSPIKSLQTPILPISKQPWTWLSNWIIKFAKAMGSNLDKPESLTKASLQTFYKSPIYRMEDYPKRDWKSFNEFFAREINPALRPIDVPSDPTVIVSPADSVFDGAWPIEKNSVVFLKYIPWHIQQLLDDSKYKNEFGGGVFTHSFLAPHDYHRQHAPVPGIVREARVIPGLCYLEVEAVTDESGNTSLSMRRGLPAPLLGRGAPKGTGGAAYTGSDISAPDTPGYQFLQARGLIVIDNPTIGLVAVLPIGMAQVSSVKLTVTCEQKVKKGDEISYFQCGGSDCVMVFQQKANVQFTATLGQHYNFGNQVAQAFPNQPPHDDLVHAPEHSEHPNSPLDH